MIDTSVLNVGDRVRNRDTNLRWFPNEATVIQKLPSGSLFLEYTMKTFIRTITRTVFVSSGKVEWDIIRN